MKLFNCLYNKKSFIVKAETFEIGAKYQKN